MKGLNAEFTRLNLYCSWVITTNYTHVFHRLVSVWVTLQLLKKKKKNKQTKLCSFSMFSRLFAAVGRLNDHGPTRLTRLPESCVFSVNFFRSFISYHLHLYFCLVTNCSTWHVAIIMIIVVKHHVSLSLSFSFSLTLSLSLSVSLFLSLSLSLSLSIPLLPPTHTLFLLVRCLTMQELKFYILVTLNALL